jgi:hypothetical protein
MNYSDEQRALIERLGEVSTAVHATYARQHAAHLVAGENVIDAITALRRAMEESRELIELHQRYGDLWREFLDTL